MNQNNKWPKIIQRLGFSGAKGISSILKSHYEKIVLPFDEFVKNALVSCPRSSFARLTKPFIRSEADHYILLDKLLCLSSSLKCVTMSTGLTSLQWLHYIVT